MSACRLSHAALEPLVEALKSCAVHLVVSPREQNAIVADRAQLDPSTASASQSKLSPLSSCKPPSQASSRCNPLPPRAPSPLFIPSLPSRHPFYSRLSHGCKPLPTPMANCRPTSHSKPPSTPKAQTRALPLFVRAPRARHSSHSAKNPWEFEIPKESQPQGCIS